MTQIELVNFVEGGGAKMMCILCHLGVQLILANCWARPAILVAAGFALPIAIVAILRRKIKFGTKNHRLVKTSGEKNIA